MYLGPQKHITETFEKKIILHVYYQMVFKIKSHLACLASICAFIVTIYVLVTAYCRYVYICTV